MRDPRQSGSALRRLTATGLGVLLIGAPSLGCGSGADDSEPAGTGGAAAAPSPGAIATGDFFYEPATTAAKVGDRVTWENVGAVPHTVKGPGFSSPSLDPGDEFEHTFTKPGRYEYLCTLHPTRMSGVVEVGR